MDNDAPVKKAIGDMPKVELHRHLAGSITPGILAEAAARFDAPVPARSAPELARKVVLTRPMESLKQVLDCFAVFAAIFTSAEVVEFVTRRVVEDAARDNVRYLELRFSPGFMAFAHGLNLVDVVEAVIAGTTTAAKEHSVVVPLIAIASREMGPNVCMETFKLASAYRPHIVGVDLAGDEDNYPPELFEEAFEFAHSRGLKVTVHAGEQANPENVRTAIQRLHAARIGHGIRIAGHRDLIELVREREVALEISVTSNYIVGAVQSPQDHPICRLKRDGVIATVNSDDPALFGITLSSELELYAGLCSRSLGDLVADQLEALKHGFAPEVVKGVVRQQLYDWWNRT